ncbi:phosphate-starvation-inducible protein PsiE [Lactococcus cremoris subsp. cremoris UC509.9]|jgi:protein PsiE|uniref:Protein PsiE n=1 Tax=Lactococcus lactis subsp. cremoris TaxID=1359 RepID=A0AAJ6MJA7_LACLC|nr:phosphate-starvation-inducible protein PsiE [Lactococcus cremoris]AFW91907.1 phosphate-starvation-inducible protein PsiE [Lactococcus cremoris subsp. cremoris UC509.9]ARD91618.1 phosphate-starvation-inducible protein PsiE [Lactococcus cremoris]MRM68438.1 phosphate-starvation-inducible protein PsiE [Lactococcus cremoris]QJD20161.1 phosphate-starvation-inducible protein PsiE [Lactococcus cremoris]QRZ30150.1 phosphate-starvation-inducible protein PsiE [Lactococcus cremoris]
MKIFFNHIELKFANLLSKISFMLLMVVGLLMVYFLFREVYNLVLLAFLSESEVHYYDILESILSFFIFFEFLTLIITSLRNKGHVSLIFLLSLGITSLIRLLLTYHERLVGVLLIASAILILIIGVFILKKFIFPNDDTADYF